LVCHGLGVDKSISVSKDYSNTPFIVHLQTKHKDKFNEYLSLKDAQQPSQSQLSQSRIRSFFSSQTEAKDKFKQKFARWVLGDNMPLTLWHSASFKSMFRTPNKNLDVPSYQTLLVFLHSTKLRASSKMKAFTKGNYYALATDHWTSFAKENYGAITLHLINDFQLHAFDLSCVKHENSCFVIEMEKQLLSDLDLWELDKHFFLVCRK
jgi:hypothetical protein